MKFCALLALTMVLAAATAVVGLEATAYQMREDFGNTPLNDGAISYYYYIPCPTYSWFWSYTGWEANDMVGAFFTVGDQSTGGFDDLDPFNCHTVEALRVLDFAGYGTVYPGLFTVEFDLWCSDEQGCPVGGSIWNSGPYETGFGWNYVTFEPPLCVTDCAALPGPPSASPRVLVTARMVGSDGTYPAWGMDNIGTPVDLGCAMHDSGCLPALYPRPVTSAYPTVHSGYYGPNFQYCPPLWFADGADTTPDAGTYGFIELAWRLYLACEGPTGAESSSWGNIKRIYR
ncbi:MAG: hypothetical protein PVH52_07855 [bacterium]|jgi:hypothetical protein